MLLIQDGHASHVSIELIECAKADQVYLLWVWPQFHGWAELVVTTIPVSEIHVHERRTHIIHGLVSAPIALPNS